MSLEEDFRSSVLATIHEKAWVLGHADDSATNVFRVPSPIETYVSSIPSLGKCEQQQALSQLYSLLKDDDSDGDGADDLLAAASATASTVASTSLASTVRHLPEVNVRQMS